MSQDKEHPDTSRKKMGEARGEGEAPLDDPAARGIAIGTALLGIYVMDKLLGEEWYEVDDKGNVTHKQKGLIEGILE